MNLRSGLWFEVLQLIDHAVAAQLVPSHRKDTERYIFVVRRTHAGCFPTAAVVPRKRRSLGVAPMPVSPLQATVCQGRAYDAL